VRELAAAPVGSRPTYVAHDLRGLLEPHPQVEVNGETARSGEATATFDGTYLHGDPATDDGLRALIALGWALADRGVRVAPPTWTANG